MQVGAFFYYIEQTMGKGLPIDLDQCAKDIGAKEDVNWPFMLVCLYCQYDFMEQSEIILARDATVRIFEMINWPEDRYVEGMTKDSILKAYDRMIHPENYPPPSPDPLDLCADYLTANRDRLSPLGVSFSIVWGLDCWYVRITGPPEREEEVMAKVGEDTGGVKVIYNAFHPSQGVTVVPYTQ